MELKCKKAPASISLSSYICQQWSGLISQPHSTTIDGPSAKSAWHSTITIVTLSIAIQNQMFLYLWHPPTTDQQHLFHSVSHFHMAKRCPTQPHFGLNQPPSDPVTLFTTPVTRSWPHCVSFNVITDLSALHSASNALRTTTWPIEHCHANTLQPFLPSRSAPPQHLVSLATMAASNHSNISTSSFSFLLSPCFNAPTVFRLTASLTTPTFFNYSWPKLLKAQNHFPNTQDYCSHSRLSSFPMPTCFPTCCLNAQHSLKHTNLGMRGAVVQGSNVDNSKHPCPHSKAEMFLE